MNIGVHTGSLWSATGQQFATATFSNESTTGWQTVTFASRRARHRRHDVHRVVPRASGHYSERLGHMALAGIDNFPLHVPIHGATYTYSAGFPPIGSDVDYGVDVVFTVPASVVPTVTASDPGDGDTNIPINSTVNATFNTSILAGTTTMTVTPSGRQCDLRNIIARLRASSPDLHTRIGPCDWDDLYRVDSRRANSVRHASGRSDYVVVHDRRVKYLSVQAIRLECQTDHH